MNRIALTNGNGKWFDADKAEGFKEGTRWDGSNWISKSTNSQWVHEHLYRTAGGKWILNHWSDYQGSIETYCEINNSQAAAWLVKNNYEPHEACETEFAALEIQ